MKYLSIDSVINAYCNNAKSTKSKFWGVLAILSSIKKRIEPCVAYSFSTAKAANILENLFSLKKDKKKYDNKSVWNIVFSKHWLDKLPNQMFSEQPNVFDVAVWFLRNEAFEDDADLSSCVCLFMEKTGLTRDQLGLLFSHEDRTVSFEEKLYSEKGLLEELSYRFGNFEQSEYISAEGKFLVSSPGEFSRAPFIQTLYSGQQTLECLLLTQIPISNYYGVEGTKASKSVDDLPLQQIFFGAPGTGKSYSINCNACITDDNSIRTTFHPDCDYSTFVGCYKPALNDASGELTYRFVPQAFTEAYVRAWLKPDEPFFLIIEEINRGNCAQIFGDVFQLLDRDDRGYSAYRIAPDRDLQRYLQQQFADSDIGDASIKSGKKMQLPPNLHIWATMNTSDQSLFPIDSAFKRRWDWRYVPIDCTDRGHYIDCGGGRRYVWASFVRQANERIEAVTQSEDKKLGYWFAARKGHDAISSDRFVSKVVFYLWNDVFKDCAGEAGSIFTGNCDSFHRFFTDGGEVNADLVAEFLDGLGVERLEPADEPQTDA